MSLMSVEKQTSMLNLYYYYSLSTLTTWVRIKVGNVSCTLLYKIKGSGNMHSLPEIPKNKLSHFPIMEDAIILLEQRDYLHTRRSLIGVGLNLFCQRVKCFFLFTFIV